MRILPPFRADDWEYRTYKGTRVLSLRHGNYSIRYNGNGERYETYETYETDDNGTLRIFGRTTTGVVDAIDACRFRAWSEWVLRHVPAWKFPAIMESLPIDAITKETEWRQSEGLQLIDPGT